MMKVKIDEDYIIGVNDSNNLMLYKWMYKQIKVNGKLTLSDKKTLERIGYFGTFHGLVKCLIDEKVKSSGAETIIELDIFIRRYIEGINFDGIVREFHRKVINLETKNKELERKLKE